jgi:hypothetical protein
MQGKGEIGPASGAAPSGGQPGMDADKKRSDPPKHHGNHQDDNALSPPFDLERPVFDVTAGLSVCRLPWN